MIKYKQRKQTRTIKIVSSSATILMTGRKRVFRPTVPQKAQRFLNLSQPCAVHCNIIWDAWPNNFSGFISFPKEFVWPPSDDAVYKCYFENLSRGQILHENGGTGWTFKCACEKRARRSWQVKRYSVLEQIDKLWSKYLCVCAFLTLPSERKGSNSKRRKFHRNKAHGATEGSIWRTRIAPRATRSIGQKWPGAKLPPFWSGGPRDSALFIGYKESNNVSNS